MNKYRHEITIEILVGLFMFVVLIALSIFTIVLSRENLFKQTYQYEFVFPEIGGLREGDNVYLRGMNIGRVKQTELYNNRVHVYVSLDIPVALRRGYQISVVDASMLGGKYLKISEGPDSEPLLGDQVTILGSEPLDLVADLGATIDSLQILINDVSEGKGTLGKLLKDDAVYENLVVVTEDIKKIGHTIEQGEGTIGKLLYDDAVYEDARSIMADLRSLSERLAAGEGTLGRLMATDDAVYDDLSAALAAIRGIAESVNEGEGTLGLLVRDAQLYEESTLLMEDLRAAVDDLRESSPITSFGSVLFGAF